MSGAADDLVRGLTKVVSLPEIFMKVEAILDNPNSSALDLARVIGEDAALTARLLRLVNSPFYGFVAKVDTVTGAIMLMGMQQLREMVLASSVLRVFRSISGEVLNMEMFWRHSVACGVVARCLAALRGETNVERFFVAGLLHDIGRLILLMQRPVTMAKMLSRACDEQRLLYLVEQEELGFNHAFLGGLLLQNWKLPARLVESLSYHHAPRHAHNFPMDAAIIHVADVIANAVALGSSGETLVPPLDADAWAILGISGDQMPLVLKTLQDQYAGSVSFILGH